MNFQFKYEWISGESARGEELNATWASFSILSKDRFVTEFIDDSVSSVRTSLFLPLYPIAEWFAFNWWFLIGEIAKLDNETSISRHNLKYASEGFAVPDVIFSATGSNILIDWTRRDAENQNIRFISYGKTYVEVAEFKLIVSEFIRGVISRLDSKGIKDSALQNEWAAISEIEDDEIEYCELSACIGEDPFNSKDQTEQLILGFSKIADPELMKEVFRSITLDKAQNDIKAISSLLVEAKNWIKPAPSQLRHIGNRIKSDEMPWLQGYQLAIQARNVINSDWNGPISSEAIFQLFGVNTCDFDIHEGYLPIEAIGMRTSVGIGIASTKRIFADNFLAARVIGEILASKKTSVISNSYSDSQKRNRAFAAEFLAPALRLKEAITRDFVGSNDIDMLSYEFCVPANVIIHQLENHKIARYREV